MTTLTLCMSPLVQALDSANMMSNLTKLGGAGTAEVACNFEGITGRPWWNMWEAVQALAVVFRKTPRSIQTRVLVLG